MTYNPVGNNMDIETEFGDLVGLTMQSVAHHRDEHGDDMIVFTVMDGRKFKLYHINDYGDSIHLVDIEGDLGDLVGSPLIQAEESSRRDSHYDWTFYRLATERGWATISWGGSYEEYYTTDVLFEEIL